ncbi:unnamed protein product [Withania somnifera]
MPENDDPLRRSLVGSLSYCDEIPTRIDWSRQNHCLELEWWSPTWGAIPDQVQYDWFWVQKAMKELGDQCGGWIETEEETQLKKHLWWGRLRVKGSTKNIPAFVEISDGDYNFSLLVWFEAPARFKLIGDEEHANQAVGVCELFSGERGTGGSNIKKERNPCGF